MSSVPESEEFFQLVERAGRYLRRHALYLGVALVALATLGWMTAAVAVDLLAPLSTSLRVIFGAGFWLLLVATAAGLLVWPALRPMKLKQIALRIEQSIGGMHNRLLTVMDLHDAEMQSAGRLNRDMVERLMLQTKQKLAGFQIGDIVNRRPLEHSLLALAGVTVVSALLCFACWERVPTAVARILRPTADIPPVTWLRIAPPHDLRAAHGDPLLIEASLSRGEADELSLNLEQPDGSWVVYPMRRIDPQHFAYTLDAVTSDYRYKLSSGDTWTGTHRIQMIPRPIIESAAVAIRLPEYMRRSEPLPVAAETKRIESPLGSQLEVTATVDGDVAAGEILLLKRTAEIQDQVQDEEHVWFEDELPADATTDTPWRWSTAQAYSGLKSFLFARGRRPFGFSTRLNPLQVPQDAAVFFYIKLEAADCPQQIRVRIAAEFGDVMLVAGKPLEQPAAVIRAVGIGPLPKPGQWARLEVPATSLGANPTGVKLTGMTFETDGGQANFDRPGFLTRKSQKVEVVKVEQIGTLPMTLAEGSKAASDSGAAGGQGSAAAKSDSPESLGQQRLAQLGAGDWRLPFCDSLSQFARSDQRRSRAVGGRGHDRSTTFAGRRKAFAGRDAAGLAAAGGGGPRASTIGAWRRSVCGLVHRPVN